MKWWEKLFSSKDTTKSSGPSGGISYSRYVPPPPNPNIPSEQIMRELQEKEARVNNPAVKDAWEKYQIVLKLTIGEENELDLPEPPAAPPGRTVRTGLWF